MSTRELQQAVEDFRRHLAAQPATVTAAGDEGEAEEAGEDEGPAGEYKAAEYIIFSLALDTYVRHLEETIAASLQQKTARLKQIEELTALASPEDAASMAEEAKQLRGDIEKLEAHKKDPVDDVIKRGLVLLRRLDRDIEAFKGFIDGHLQSNALKQMLTRALARPARTPAGAGRRALGLRTLLNRGGTKLQRGIFDTPRARQQIKVAISASMLDNADAALDLFAGMTVTNAYVRTWIDQAVASARAMSEGPQVSRLVNPVERASTEAVEQTPRLMAQQAQQLGAQGAEAVQKAEEAKQEVLAIVEQSATAAAREAIDQNEEMDEPPTRSEVVGLATAAAVAAMSDPSNPQNVPEPLKRLDEEQRAAAMTDGRVLVAAGAGAGKSTTLVARVNYLMNDRRVSPNRILVTSFNKKAANELGEKIERSTGLNPSTAGMMVGTMHSLFRQFINDYGEPDERVAMSKDKPSGFIGAGGNVARTVQRMWEECYNSEERPIPKLKTMLLYKSQWSGNDISPAQAKEMATTDEERDAADWYAIYEGLKGGVPGWKPPCEERAKANAEEVFQERLDQWRARGSNPKYRPQKPGTTYEVFMAKERQGGMRLGDFGDMIAWFRDIMKRDPGARKKVQSMFDHVLIDECQDLDSVQHEAFKYMTEHITDGSDGKSLWMVGDDKQSIYLFRGARPDLFTNLHEKEGWTTRMIRTNYRCEPEIVEVANKLIAHNEGQIPMAANANPTKPRGVGSIRLETPIDDAQAALDVVERIKSGGQGLDPAAMTKFYGTNSVLCRTNAELHSYETACIIRGVPYARKGSGSFLGSPETEAMLGYVELVMGTDAPKMQKALGKILSKPNRFWLGPKDCEEVVENAIREYARRTGNTIKSVNPMQALRNAMFREALAGAIYAKRRKGSVYGFSLDLERMSTDLDELQAETSQPDFTTEHLLNSILSLKGKGMAVNPKTGRAEMKDQTFREALTQDLRDKLGSEDDTGEDEVVGEEGLLGNISFLYKLAEPDPTDPRDQEQSPTTPAGFQAKIERFQQLAKDLRIDLNVWDKENPGKTPPAVYLGTVHSVKGAEWTNTFVQMPKGKFPIEKPRKEGEEEELPPEVQARKAQKEQAELEAERRLAYVALTRAAKNLTVVCPSIVGGRKAGPSFFVSEAGLVSGENVPKGAATPKELPPEPAEMSPVVTASEPWEPDSYEWAEGPAGWNPFGG